MARPVGIRGAIFALVVALGLIASPLASAQDPAAGPRLDARAWLLVDARDGTPLAAKAEGRSVPVASTTKLMTAYLALEELPLKRTIRVPAYSAAPAESIVGLERGERVSVRDLLTAMMLPSANDAAVALARGVSGSVPRFVKRMNAAAGRLGLDDTTYANPIGLDDPANLSSARDLAELSMVLRESRVFRRIVASSSATIESDRTTRQVVTRNTLMGSDPSVDGIKTGHTLGAGYVLVASAERRGIPLISVVLGTDSEAARDAESAELLDYGFGLYRSRTAVRRREALADVAVSFEDDPLAVVSERRIAVRARAEQQLETAVEVPGEVEGPIAEGERIGRAIVTLDGERVAAVRLLAGRAVAEPGIVDRIGGPLAAVLIIGGLSVIVIGGFAALRGRQAPGGSGRTPEERMQSRQERKSRRARGAGR